LAQRPASRAQSEERKSGAEMEGQQEHLAGLSAGLLTEGAETRCLL